jgi:hypothetical protein
LFDKFNDLSGLILLLGNFYALTHLNSYLLKNEKNQLKLVVGLFPIFNVFFFQFISAPSPDMAIYVLTLLVCHQFVKCYKTYSKEAFFIVVIIALFMILIKPTTLFFCLLPIILFKRYYIFTRASKLKILVFTSLTFLLILIKNIIITGNAFFPIHLSDSFETMWSLPNNIQSYFSEYGKAYGYHSPLESFKSDSWLIKLKNWFFASGLHGAFNKLLVVLLVLMPLIIKKFYNQKAYWLFYTIGILTILLLFVISPQYRFFFPFIMIFGLLLLSLIVMHKNTLKTILVAFTIMAAIPLIFGMSNQQISTNKYHEVNSHFSTDYLIQPYGLSKYKTDFKTLDSGNSKFNSPTQIDFFWGTGNVPIPALNQKQLNYFKTYFGVIPQQKTENLKDGFYSKHVSKK